MLMTTLKPLRVVLADDHRLVREGLRSLLEAQEEFSVVGEAVDGHETVKVVEQLQPDLLLLDVSMPGAGGVAVAQAVAASCPQVRIIAVTRYTDQAFVTRMLRAGAAGYVLKQSPTAELLRAIRVVATGETYVDASLRAAPASQAPPAPPPDERAAAAPLSPVEEQILQLFARAYSNQEIAQQLSLTVEDVTETRTAAMRKIGLKTRADAVAYADRHGWP